MNSKRLLKKVVLITGATGQLGRQFCHAFDKEGAHIYVSDLKINNCKEFIKNLENKNNHKALFLDVSKPDLVKEAFSIIKNDFSKIDIIVNNAGISIFDDFKERNFTDFMEVLKVNIGGTFLCIKEGSNLMKSSKTEGSIINIGSIYGMVSGDYRIYTDSKRNTSECYGASKAAIIHMTKYFSVHLAQHRIRVNCISPGGIYNDQGKDFVKNYSYRTPMSRMGKDTEIAKAAIFLASNESSYMTGHNMVIDGGFTSW